MACLPAAQALEGEGCGGSLVFLATTRRSKEDSFSKHEDLEPSLVGIVGSSSSQGPGEHLRPSRARSKGHPLESASRGGHNFSHAGQLVSVRLGHRFAGGVVALGLDVAPGMASLNWHAGGVDTAADGDTAAAKPALLFSVGNHPCTHEPNLATVHVHVDVIHHAGIARETVSAGAAFPASGHKAPDPARLSWGWLRRLRRRRHYRVRGSGLDPPPLSPFSDSIHFHVSTKVR